MTTVVFRDGVMAADSRIIDGNLIEASTYRKVGRLGRRAKFAGVYAVTGATTSSQYLLRLLNSGAWEGIGTPGQSSDGQVHVALTDGRFFFVGVDGVTECAPAPFYAAGSGRAIALGALQMGASATKAVKVACKFDVYSGGPVRKVVL